MIKMLKEVDHSNKLAETMKAERLVKDREETEKIIKYNQEKMQRELEAELEEKRIRAEKDREL